MDFKKYVSTLFYLNEALSYASDQIQTQIQTLIRDTVDEAFEDTGYFCFKAYNDLKLEFPNLLWKWNSPKDSLKKTSLSLSVRRALTAEELTRVGTVEKYRQVELKNEQLSVCYGDCRVSSVVYNSPTLNQDGPVLLISFEINKAKAYEDVDELQPLIECLRALNNI